MKTRAHRLSAEPGAERRKTKGLECIAVHHRPHSKDVYLHAVSYKIPHLPAGWQVGGHVPPQNTERIIRKQMGVSS